MSHRGFPSNRPDSPSATLVIPRSVSDEESRASKRLRIRKSVSWKESRPTEVLHLRRRGWGRRIRTSTYGSRDRCPTIRRSPRDLNRPDCTMPSPLCKVRTTLVRCTAKLHRTWISRSPCLLRTWSVRSPRSVHCTWNVRRHARPRSALLQVPVAVCDGAWHLQGALHLAVRSVGGCRGPGV